MNKPTVEQVATDIHKIALESAFPSYEDILKLVQSATASLQQELDAAKRLAEYRETIRVEANASWEKDLEQANKRISDLITENSVLRGAIEISEEQLAQEIERIQAMLPVVKAAVEIAKEINQLSEEGYQIEGGDSPALSALPEKVKTFLSFPYAELVGE